MRGKIHIGTSGWRYKHWLGRFYPQNLPAKEMLRFYARYFDTVELNNSFYHLPASTTFDSWRDHSPTRFLFAVKGSRFITHMKKLKDPESSTAKFFLGAERLENKLGPILFQLPPRWNVNIERLANFLEVLPKQHRYVIEFRDESWIVEEVFEVLRQHNAAFCIHDLGGQQTPLEITADFTYLRFHGPGSAKYVGSYSRRTLQDWANKIADWQKRLKAVYAYFNNDIGGAAVRNAVDLQRLLAH
jgi:uncharacterized protein YecE (DUF72 family)